MEYIYISDRKLDAFAGLLEPRSLDRIRALNVSLGPVGGGIELADAPVKTKHQVVVEIEAAIRADRQVEAPEAPHLAPGDWIALDHVRASFGTMGAGDSSVGFLADLGETGVVLIGSVDHLLGARPAEVEVGINSSLPAEVGRLLHAAGGGQTDARLEALAGYAFTQLWRQMTRFAPPQPVTLLARATHVFSEGVEKPRRVVAGTPLYVAFA